MKPDDSSLSPQELEAVRQAAVQLLNKGDGWNRFPTPVADLMAAAHLQIAPLNAFDERGMERFLKQIGQAASSALKTAISKVLAVFDVQANFVHVDPDVNREKQCFLQLHEAGHKEIPHQSGLFRWIQDCSKTLAPEVADLFDREANNFARIVLFQDDRFATIAADSDFGIKVPLSVGRRFGASVYASIREYVRCSSKACAVIVLEPPQSCPINGMIATVRRFELSPEFVRRFGSLGLPNQVTPHSPLATIIPASGSRMSSPIAVPLCDRNDERHEFVGEGFSTPYNVFLLIHAQSTLRPSVYLA